jgi:hypothetical protein
VNGGATATIPIVAANWNVPVAVTVAAVDDPDLETNPHPCVLSMEASSADGRYHGLTASHNVAVTDDDVAEATLTTAGGLAVTEAGPGTDTFDVVLRARPSDDVTITFSDDAQTTSAPSVTFTRLTWNTPQTVTVTAVDDDIDEPATHTGTITLGVTSVATGFGAAQLRVDGLLSGTLGVAVIDDDTAGLTATPTALDLSENGGTDTYSLVLESEPVADVVVTIAATGLCTTSVPTHTFTSGDWDTPFVVTVTAGNDDIDGTANCSVANTTGSTDANYVGLSATASGEVADDDTAGIVVSAAAGSVFEQGATTTTYTVVLATEPTADVVVVATPDGQLTIEGSATRTFTTIDWDTPKTITVKAVDDAVVETSPHTGVVIHTATSSDGNFNTIAIAGRTVAIVDNDTTTTLTLTPAPPHNAAATSATATVAGGAATPTGTVQFTLDSSAVGGPVTLASGAATIDLGTLAGGAHVLAASYFGDASHSPSSGLVNFEVTSQPVADDELLTVFEDAPATAANVLIGDVDFDVGDTLSVTAHTPAGHGTGTCSSSDCTYQPDANFNGSDSFTYTVGDGTGLVDTAIVNVTVTPVDDPPTVPAVLTVIVPNGQPVTFELLNGAVDVDGDVLRIVSYSQPGHGTVVCTTAGSCTYTPNAGYAGPDQFAYEVGDGQPSQPSNPLVEAAPVTGVVLLQVQPAPTTTAPTNAPTITPSTTAVPGPTTTVRGPGALPPTGSSSGGSATWALLALAAGLGLVGTARRRRA